MKVIALVIGCADLAGCVDSYNNPPGSPGPEQHSTANPQGAAGDGGNSFDGGDSVDGGNMGDGGPIVSSAVFNPGVVYIDGTIADGIAGADLIAPVDAPRSSYPGLPTYASKFKVRPDGKILFISGFSAPNGGGVVRIFTPRDFTYDSNSARYFYPTNSDAVSPAVPTPHCDGSQGGAGDYLLDPDDGTLIYTCAGSKFFGPDGGAYVDAGVTALGHNHLTLGLDQSNNDILIDATGAVLAVNGLPTSLHPFKAARASTDGFWVVPSGTNTPLELWDVPASGVATRVVSYGAAPSGYRSSGDMPALDGSGNLFEHMFYSQTSDDALIKFPVGGGPGTVVYTETGVALNDLRVPPPYFAFWHISSMFTGP